MYHWSSGQSYTGRTRIGGGQLPEGGVRLHSSCDKSHTCRPRCHSWAEAGGRVSNCVLNRTGMESSNKHGTIALRTSCHASYTITSQYSSRQYCGTADGVPLTQLPLLSHAHPQVTLMAALNATCDDITADAWRGWTKCSKSFRLLHGKRKYLLWCVPYESFPLHVR